ncbi:MAG: PAS domain S-box protein [Proteobacteria bacterium]|nr:PAS domain S-box protein [Pseudomonadota bacterium]
MPKFVTPEERQQKIEELEQQLADYASRFALFEQFVEASGDGMGWADINSIVRYANPALCRMFGEKCAEDVCGRSVLDFYSEKTQEKIKNEVFPVVLSEGAWTGELSVHASTGRKLPTLNTLHALKDKNDKPVSYANVVTDLTERKKIENELRLHRDHLKELVAERTDELNELNRALAKEISERKLVEVALRESETRFREMTERLPVSVFETDERLNIIYANKIALEEFGFTNEALRNGLPLLSTIAPKDHPRLVDNYKKIVRGENAGQSEYTGKRTDGTTLPILVHSDAILKDGQPQGIRGIAIDITELKQAEEKLQYSEARYRSLVEHMQDGILVVQDEIVAFVNDAFTDIIGYSADEIVGTKFNEFLAPEDSAMVADRYARRQSGEPVPNNYEFRMLHKSGRRVHVNVTVGIIQFEGRIASLGTVKDITEKLRAEEEMSKLEAKLNHAQRMEALGTLTGGIAHNFNNVLMGIQGKTSSLLLTKDPSHSDFDHLKEIENYVQSASMLTRELLGYGRGGKYEIQTTDLSDVLKHQAGIFGQTRKEIRIHENYCDDLWTTAVDRAQMEQVFLNLFINSWQAMPTGGELYIETENITLTADDHPNLAMNSGQYAKVTVTDTGAGIAAEILDRIFEPFFSGRENDPGTGLGLASVYGIVKNHDGYVFAYSEEGKGTTFNIYIPRANPDDIPIVKSPLKEAQGTVKGSGLVLIVDDEEMVREVCSELLEALGYHVIVAKNGREAVKIYKDSPGSIDMVILDMIMSEMSGEITYEKLKEINPEVRVLLSSGYSENDNVKKILDMGCNGFIQKPYNIDRLSHKIKEILA